MIDVVVVSTRPEADDIRSFQLARPDGGPLPAFEAGAHIDVHLPDGLIRQYSLYNSPDERHHYRIGVLLEAQSRGGSRAMHALREGDRLTVSEPRNLFALDDSAGPSLLFAGGIGITPLLSMAERLWQEGRDFELHYSARHPDRAAFLEPLRRAPFADRVHLYFDEGPRACRLDAANLLAAAAATTHLYVCGPTGYMDHILGHARARGWAETRLHREDFAAGAQTGHAFRVRIASSGEEIEVGDDQSVAQALEEHGVIIPLSCEQGICGTCLTGVLEGEPDHRDDFLTDEERRANDQFTPCCSRSKTPLLVLDL